MTIPRGKNVYLTYESLHGLEEVGKRYINRNFKQRGKHTSYNKACLYLLQLIGIAEKLRVEPIEQCDDD